MDPTADGLHFGPRIDKLGKCIAIAPFGKGVEPVKRSKARISHAAGHVAALTRIAGKTVGHGLRGLPFAGTGKRKLIVQISKDDTSIVDARGSSPSRP